MTNAWHTNFETGLLDDFDFTIVRSFFAPDAKYNNGETLLLQWEGTTDNPDVPETHAWFPIGKGWFSKDGGKSIVHESGKADKYFVQSSWMARLIARCVEDFGIQDLLAQRGDPFHSATWVGLRFHMKNEKVDFGPGIDAKAKVFPVKFLGEVSGSGSAAASTPAAASSNGGGQTAAEKIAAAKAKAAAANGSSLRDQVTAIFARHTDFATAQDEALALDGVTDDAGLLDELMDESGLWATVKANA